MRRYTAIMTACLFLIPTALFAARGSLDIRVMPSPPNLIATVQFTEPSGNNILDADETGKIVITLENRGKGDAFDVQAELETDKRISGLSYGKKTTLGTVPAGKKMKWEIPIQAFEDIATSDVRLTVDLKEANGFDPDQVKLSFKTRAFEPPKLVVADMGINDKNGNNRIEPREIVELTIRVQNVGHGDARNVTADLNLGKNVFIADESPTRFDLGVIPSGKFKDVKFSFYTNNRIAKGEKIPITVNLNEARPRFAVKKDLPLTMYATGKRLVEVVVKGEESQPKGEIQLAGGLSVDVDQNIPEGTKAGRYDIAVIIGNRNYSSSGSPDVAYANRDAQIMKEYLTRTMGFDSENIIYAEDATLSKFNEIFGTDRDYKGKLFKYVKPGISNVYVYYVGHGAPDLESQEAYFVPVDANPQFIKSSGYRLQTFYDNLGKVPAKKMIIVLDSCFSGNSEKGMLFKNVSPSLVKVKKEFQGPANAILITSAGIDQVSTWYPEKRHSLFTYYFLKGIGGEADANKDGRITVSEMQTYLKEQVPYMARRLSGTEQQPVVTGDEQATIAVLKK